MGTINNRKNLHLYLKVPGSSAVAFAAGDELPATLLDALNPSGNGNSFQFDTYGSDGVNRVPDLRDLTIQFTALVDPDDPIISRIITAWEGDRYLDALVVAGDAPATGAKNLVTYARMAISNLTPAFPKPGLAQIQVSLEASDGTTIATALNAEAFPSL